jgi:hypothetical protein
LILKTSQVERELLKLVSDQSFRFPTVFDDDLFDDDLFDDDLFDDDLFDDDLFDVDLFDDDLRHSTMICVEPCYAWESPTGKPRKSLDPKSRVQRTPIKIRVSRTSGRCGKKLDELLERLWYARKLA